MRKRRPWLLRRRTWRWLQLLTGVHWIHDIRYSYGWKFPLLERAWFEHYGWRETTKFHDCTLTGKY